MNNEQLADLLNLDRSTLPPDGGERFNRLVFARSPYLLQHADNPTDWREWGDDAFAEARSRGVPLFVSIGYATCHWCHVMAHESFADPEVAAVLNELFVPIKVDREERPDLDDFYMTASRVLTGSGGWPLNVFIDHDRRPFFTITYLPKYPRSGAPGFINLLRNISVLWRERREMVANNSAEIVRAIGDFSIAARPGHNSVDSLAAEAYGQLRELFDHQYGGFGTGAKFPMPVNILFLLSRRPETAPDARAMAFGTLVAMANGGINDQLSGGFHRYTVDQRWLVPHFEKMLYDQAMLVMAYTEAFRISSDPLMLATAITTARFVLAELAQKSGGFCGALDADTEGEEGLYYTWSVDEFDRIAGPDAELCRDYWGVSATGHLEGRNILHIAVDPDKLAADRGMTREAIELAVANARSRLISARESRVRPLRDPKVICAWNGLMIAALARLAAVTGDKQWLRSAEQAAEFILANLATDSGRLLRNWLETPAPVPAFAEDYAYFCLGLAELANNGDILWQERLKKYGTELQRLFIAEDGKISLCGNDAEQMPVDIPPLQDSVVPSTAAVAASVFLHMDSLFPEEGFIATARRIIECGRGSTESNPSSCLSLIMAEEALVRGRIHTS